MDAKHPAGRFLPFGSMCGNWAAPKPYLGAMIDRLYRPVLALHTDLYQLTMARGYFEQELHDREAVFELFYRKNPFGGHYAVVAGLPLVLDYLEQLQFRVDDIQYLAGLRDPHGKALFDESFLNFLQRFAFRCSIDAVPEGRFVQPHQPLVRVRGPLWQCQLIETALLNIINFSTLVATKAHRIVAAAGAGTVLEFGLRRAQGIDGGVSASRAAYLGGCAATSNVLAGRLCGIPVRGTHAHSWVMLFESEVASFEAYAAAYPGNTVLLVDTYDTDRGVQRAIEVGLRMREAGHELMGIRLDSGDLVASSQRARAMLDEAGLGGTRIIASDSLDEYRIAELNQQGARIDVWGVGTRLATAYDQPALGGVYKLTAVRNADGAWEDRIKRSATPAKSSTPGMHGVKRYHNAGRPVADVCYDLREEAIGRLVDADGRAATLPDYDSVRELLVPVYEQGQRVYTPPPLIEARATLLKTPTPAPDFGLLWSRRLHQQKVRLLNRQGG